MPNLMNKYAKTPKSEMISASVYLHRIINSNLFSSQEENSVNGYLRVLLLLFLGIQYYIP